MKLNAFKKSLRFRDDAGIALLTTLLLLFLMSSLLVGFSILLAANQQLAGTSDQQTVAFYGAEAGMEQLTAGLGNLFSQTYAPSMAQVQAITNTTPNIPGIAYITGNNTSGYTITPLSTDANGNPSPTITTIKSGTYQGMTAMATEYTLMVNARTPNGREVTLKRTTQTVGIPMFQFGIFCDADCSFFAGPNFNFGGRMHTNGNLFLASQSSLQMSDRVDAFRDVIRDTLENGFPTAGTYTGTINITTAPGGGNYRSLGMGEGSLTALYTNPTANPNWPTVSLTDYNGNLQNGKGANPVSLPFSGSAKQLNLGIVTIGSGQTQSVDLIRRPFPGETPQVTNERYFAQASLRVLLSDDPNDIMNLPCVDGTTQPFDLSKIAVTPNAAGAPWTTAGYYAPAAALWTRMTTVTNQTPLPLASSNATGGNVYNPQDGYWLPAGYPIIKGFLKIEEQTGYGNPCGAWKDVTVEILSYGYVGRNINPVPQSFDGLNLNPQWTANPLNGDMGYGAAPGLPQLPATQLAFENLPPANAYPAGNFVGESTAASNPANTCLDPHPWAVIRLERVRDNPSTVPANVGPYNNPNNLPFTATVAQVCGVDPNTKLPIAGLQSTDFWPNVLFDSREGTLRDVPMSATNLPTLNGTMHYIEVDGANLAAWFGGKINTMVTTGQATKDPAVSPNDFLFYVSDRRGNYAGSQVLNAGWPPLSFTKKETGEYGWTDIVNLSSPATGCPNNVLDSGEDIDNTTGTSYGLFYYGAVANYIHAAGVTPVTSLLPGQLGIFATLFATGVVPNSVCPAAPGYVTDAIWPMMTAANSQAARENPPLFFRRAIKIVDANNLSAVGACPSGVSCGLTIATENPAYIQGDFNANFGGCQFNCAGVEIATSVAGDAITLLSDAWNDTNSFSSPYSLAKRQGTQSYYQTAIVGGKPLSFLQPTGTGNDYGTDGGVHNFLRYIEAWSGTLNYRGSIVALYTSRQANSTFKCCNTVYSPPNRGYNFDTNFLNPTLLPPRTPLFRSINTTGWTRLLLPGQYN